MNALGDDARGVLRPDLEALQSAPTRLLRAAVATGCSLALLGLYLASLAPGLTWAHQGADGGELLAAAAANGVPHPPGYPLYTLLLRGWIMGLGVLAPTSDVAWRGNLLSALAAATAVWFTIWTFASMRLPLPGSGRRLRLVWAAIAGLLWGIAPLLWSQALITEVYTVHSLGVALLGWAAFTPGSPARFLPATILAVAHHPTLALLLPAAFYAAISLAPNHVEAVPRNRARGILMWTGAGLLIGAFVHLRTPLAARLAPPVNWGFADNWEGFWWLISGAAYRDNLLAGDVQATLLRTGSWLGTMAREVAWVGLLPMAIGLAALHVHAPRLRTATLLWLVAPSIYAVVYYTRDSEIYLLGASWVAMMWVAVGLEVISGWLAAQHPARSGRLTGALAATAAATVVVTVVLRLPEMSLRRDHTAIDFVEATSALLEPNSIIVSRSDAETFALWYGTWAAEGPLQSRDSTVGVLPVNDSLYQFEWYQRLQAVRNPTVPGAGESGQALVQQNAGVRPIYFAEPLEWAESDLVAVPPIWRFE